MNKELIERLSECAVVCNYCADQCLNETEMLEKMVECIRLDRDCAEVCQTTANLLSRNSSNAEPLIAICEDLCRRCAEECEKHETRHCEECAKACRACEEACQQLETA